MRIIHEKIDPLGGITATAISNLLNGSDVDLATFLRETIQNSWDARVKVANNIPAVKTNLRFARVSEDGKENIINCLRADAKLDRDLINQDLFSRVLVYSDRGTTGLSGPIRVPQPGDNSATIATKRNFVNFVWMLGANDGGQNMGGQFGFGKSVFASASRIKMYAIHTRVKMDNNQFEHRFVICGMRRAEQNHPNGTGYTGRFWIGENGAGEDHSVVALNDRAREMAAWLGIDSFIGNETGTSVAIFQPKWSGSAREDHFLRVARRATVKWFWPLLRENNFEFTTGDQVLRENNFEFTTGDQVSGVEKAEIDGGYAVFAGLFDKCKKMDLDVSRQTPGESIGGRQLRALMENGNVRVVCAKVPFKPLGILGMDSMIVGDDRINGWGGESLRFVTEADDEENKSISEELPDPENTLALIRSPRMVVSYLKIDHPPSGMTFFGVFVAASREMHQRNDWDGSAVRDPLRRFAVEDILAKSEPPRHDEWNSRNLSHDKAVLIAGGAAVSNSDLGKIKTIANRSVEEPLKIFKAWCQPVKATKHFEIQLIPAGEASEFLSKNVFKTLGEGVGTNPPPIPVEARDKSTGDSGGETGGKSTGDSGGETGGKSTGGGGGETGGKSTGSSGGETVVKSTGSSGGETVVKSTGGGRSKRPSINLKPHETEMTEAPDGKIMFLTKIDANWDKDEGNQVTAVISLIDGEGKKSKLNNLAPINGAADAVTFADFSEEELDNQKNYKNNARDADEVQTDLIKASESHGFFKDNEIEQIPFLSGGMSVIIQGGVNFTHKLLTTPGKVLDISFVATRP